MDAVVDLGAAALPMQPRHADGMPVRERRVEAVDSSQTSSTHDDRASVFARDEALLTLVTGSKLQYDALVEMTAERAELVPEKPAEPLTPGQLDLYA